MHLEYIVCLCLQAILHQSTSPSIPIYGHVWPFSCMFAQNICYAIAVLCNWPHLAWLAFYNWLVYQIIVHGVQLDPAAYVWPDLASRQCSSPRINNSWQLWSWSTCAAAAASLGHFVNTWIELDGISYEGHSQINESNQIWQTIANASQSFYKH